MNTKAFSCPWCGLPCVLTSADADNHTLKHGEPTCERWQAKASARAFLIDAQLAAVTGPVRS